MVSAKLFGTALIAGAMFVAAAPVPAALASDEQQEHLGLMNLTINGHTAKDFRTSLLTCSPDAGTHPHPATACEAISNAEGDFHAIEGRTGLCPLIYDPVTVRATGVFDGRSVDYAETFSNACVAANTTGSVFAF